MLNPEVARWLELRRKGVKPLMFVHVPKTGGTYVMQLESGDASVLEGVRAYGHIYAGDQEGDLNPIYLPHDPKLARDSIIPRRVVNEHFVFSSVRNIYSWLVSYAGHAGGWNPRYSGENHYDHAAALKGFDYLVKVIANREDQWPNRKLIHCQLFSSGGDMVADHINHQESLDEDLAAMAARLELRYYPENLQRLGQSKPYSQYYNDELIELVSRTWNRELQLFGHTFDQCNRETAVIKGVIPKEQKAAIKYSWNTDILTIDGQEIRRQ